MLVKSLTALTVLSTSALAGPVVKRQEQPSSSVGNGSVPFPTSSTSSSPPTVTIYPETESGDPVTITGETNYGIDNYWGIPFAAPPVGDLRWSRPQLPTWNTTSFNATTKPPACIQSDRSLSGSTGISEDCLYLNIQAPQGANGSTASYPVLVWVYGGSFVSGSASFYDGSVIVTQAALTDKPVIYVAINYRLGVLGFPKGREAAEAGAANLGLRDVQKALEWVQEHIWAFGGDPEQVTVFGQSAGAILISELYLQPELNLFKSAIMHSGAQSTSPIGPTEDIWSRPFDLIAAYAGCGNVTYNATANVTIGTNTTAAGVPVDSPLECLKKVPADRLLEAQLRVQNSTEYLVATLFGPSVDGDLIPDQPHKLIQEGKFARKPYISGSVTDEGTGFAPTIPIVYSNQSYVALILSSLEPNGLPANVTTEVLNRLWPDVPALGSPFGTGNETFGLPSGFKQLSAIVGDAAFQAPRRWFQTQSVANGFNDVWSYLWDITAPSTDPYLGVPHSADVYYLFGLPQLATLNLTLGGSNGAITNYISTSNFTQVDAAFSNGIIDQTLNFAYYTDPNGPTGQAEGNQTYWPKYGDNGDMLQVTRSNVTVIQDNYRKEQFDYLLSQPTVFNYKRSELGQRV